MSIPSPGNVTSPFESLSLLVSNTEVASSRFKVKSSLFASTNDGSGMTLALETQSSTTALSKSPGIIAPTSWVYFRLSTTRASRTMQKFLLSSALSGSINHKGISKIWLYKSISRPNCYYLQLFILCNYFYFTFKNAWSSWKLSKGWFSRATESDSES